MLQFDAGTEVAAAPFGKGDACDHRGIIESMEASSTGDRLVKHGGVELFVRRGFEASLRILLLNFHLLFVKVRTNKDS